MTLGYITSRTQAIESVQAAHFEVADLREWADRGECTAREGLAIRRVALELELLRLEMNDARDKDPLNRPSLPG